MDEQRWENLDGGYGVPYDPRPALARLRQGDATAWDELINELHHQEYVGVASYAAVPQLVSILRERGDAPPTRDVLHTFSMMIIIEDCRCRGWGPALPDWLTEEYHAAWNSARAVAVGVIERTTEETILRLALGVVAMSKGSDRVGVFIAEHANGEVGRISDIYPTVCRYSPRELERIIKAHEAGGPGAG